MPRQRPLRLGVEDNLGTPAPRLMEESAALSVSRIGAPYRTASRANSETMQHGEPS